MRVQLGSYLFEGWYLIVSPALVHICFVSIFVQADLWILRSVTDVPPVSIVDSDHPSSL
ncbi:hypothetical protein K439DRAFT_1635168 [Ramaria rubella]|nr:hypothetical protein K439DRAFT_1635168 [Ramaria rubella]